MCLHNLEDPKDQRLEAEACPSDSFLFLQGDHESEFPIVTSSAEGGPEMNWEQLELHVTATTVSRWEGDSGTRPVAL
jgi:hypothetical protein